MPSTPASSPSTRRFDVAVRGAGIVGQTLALLLAQARLRVALVAPAKPAASADVRAYALNAASRELLRKVRAWPEPEEPDTPATPPVVTPVSGMEVYGDDGGAVHFNALRTGQEALTWIVDVPALERRLTQAVQFQGGIERLTEAPNAALTVICEGRRSSTREELGLEFDVRPYPHKAVAARLRCSQPHGGVARQWFKGGEIMALLPLDGAEGHTVALVWSVEAAQADQRLKESPEALARLIQDHCGAALGDMQMLSPAHAWPLELSRAQRWITRTEKGAVALAGDAAHAMHPLAGQGLNVGLGDVAELARVLNQREFWREPGDLKLLRRYERARQADVNAMGWATDGLFGLFAQTDSRVQLLRNWGMNGVDRLDPLKNWLARQAMGTIT
ncbi:ubiquinone biosynthesis protein UbiH [Hydrogenophaga crassostreae]|uniref:Ubiquinone biosynthesis protein UbiH n=1 Tax=Hydrogenophaga crassostreae TaxID=1763535 RepID=A0A162PAD2_9BURK|nr:FAD-dependent monooxygenase [Hydrogenophaga crassostreae]AOW14517.1 ubiquinone biosynthesis protein UbiH [Hydrogenophaga crassostreae]OAD43073.1 ubiquinone biosynthesis protein UbiH [Hydrogenophaga crassostreae]